MHKSKHSNNNINGNDPTGTFPRFRSGIKHFGDNSWLDSNIKPPENYDYDVLTAGLHPNQDSYRHWLIDIISGFLLNHSEKQKIIKLLEIGCATATEMHLFLSRYASLWSNTDSTLEIHLLDIDPDLLSSASRNLKKFETKNISIYLWQGDLQTLSSSNYKLVSIIPNDDKSTLSFPPTFDIIYSQLTFHHFSLNVMEKVLCSIYETLNNKGCIILSDICYTGIPFWDKMIWARTLHQIGEMHEEDRREFWFKHYFRDRQRYMTRNNIIRLIRRTGFSHVEILQTAYDMATIAGIKKYKKIIE